MFTDGSKRSAGVGAAVMWNSGEMSASLPREASVFSSEVHAISMAVRKAGELDGNKFVIMSDSRSALGSLDNIRKRHPICRALQHEIHKLKEVTFCWIPSHVGIENNEKVDRVAVSAACRREEYIPVDYRDWYPVIKSAIMEDWNKGWKVARQKMYEVKKTVGDWKHVRLTRREEVVITRLRTGHCRLTHGYLMSNDAPQVPPVCRFCNNAIVTVRHILLSCPYLDGERQRIRVNESGNVTAEKLQGDKAPVKEIVAMLRRIGIYGEI